MNSFDIFTAMSLYGYKIPISMNLEQFISAQNVYVMMNKDILVRVRTFIEGQHQY